jgi:gas vesicle protein
MHPKEFLVGAVIGSVLGGISALLAAPSSGEKIRKDLCKTYCNLHDKASDFADSVSERGKCISKMIGCKSQNCNGTDYAKDVFEKISKGFHSLTGDENGECHTKDFLVGGVVGGIIGAVAGLLLAPKAGEDLRQDVVETYQNVSDKSNEFAQDLNKKGRAFAKTTSRATNKWLNFAKKIVDELSDDLESTVEEVGDKVKQASDHRLNDMMEIASLGFRLWQRLKK